MYIERVCIRKTEHSRNGLCHIYIERVCVCVSEKLDIHGMASIISIYIYREREREIGKVRS